MTQMGENAGNIVRHKKQANQQLADQNDVLAHRVEQVRKNQLKKSVLECENELLRQQLERAQHHHTNINNRKNAAHFLENERAEVEKLRARKKYLENQKEELLHLRKEKAKHYQDLEIEYNQNQVKQRDLQSQNRKIKADILNKTQQIEDLKYKQNQLGISSHEQAELIKKHQEDSTYKRHQLKMLTDSLLTLDNDLIAKNVEEYTEFYKQKLLQSGTQDIENAKENEKRMLEEIQRLESELNHKKIERARILKEVDDIRHQLDESNEKEAKLTKGMKERKEQQEQNIRRLVQLRNDCINENSKINERIGQIMIDTRIVLAAIASVQIEINHYRALIGDNKEVVLQEVVPVDIETTEYRKKYQEKVSPIPAPRLTRDSSSSWTSRKSKSSKKSRRSISNVSPRDRRVVVSLTESRSSTTEIKPSRRRTISITSESEILQILETKKTNPSSSSSDFPSRSEKSSTHKIAEKFSVTSASKIPIPYSPQSSPYHHVDDVQEFRVVGDQAIRDTTDFESSETVEEKPAKQSSSRETRDTVKEWIHDPVNENIVEKDLSSASTYSSSSIEQVQDEISLTQSSIYTKCR